MKKESRKLIVTVARTEAEIREAQKLRYEVFALEMGAKIKGGCGLDADAYDERCEHVIVWDARTGRPVATTRALFSTDVDSGLGYYSQSEFIMSGVLELPGRTIEVGRTCVKREYRTGGAIASLWSGLSGLIRAFRPKRLIGCASIGLADGGREAAGIMRELREKHFLPAALRTSPRRSLPPVLPASSYAMPPLLKSYLRLGAKIGGEAFYDANFNCADVFIYLEIGALPPKARRRFLGEAAEKIPA